VNPTQFVLIPKHDPQMSIPPANDSSNEFLSHMLKSQRSIRNYIFSIHPHAQDLDDLIQQTALTLWREFEKYDTSREFLPWALRVAYFEVLRLRKHRSRDRLVFSEELLEILAEEADSASDDAPMLEAIKSCLAKLDAAHREVLLARYGSETTVSDLAARKRTKAHQLYRLLDQARSSIIICVRRHLHFSGGTPSC
jgi:RNA polymerase sigma-70 factor (ECF subfamily)